MCIRSRAGARRYSRDLHEAWMQDSVVKTHSHYLVSICSQIKQTRYKKVAAPGSRGGL